MDRWTRSCLDRKIKKKTVQITHKKADWDCYEKVLLDSMEGSLLFIVYINNLDSGMSSNINNFADNIDRLSKSDQNVGALKIDLDIV